MMPSLTHSQVTTPPPFSCNFSLLCYIYEIREITLKDFQQLKHSAYNIFFGGVGDVDELGMKASFYILVSYILKYFQ